MRKRTLARELAFKILYELDASKSQKISNIYLQSYLKEFTKYEDVVSFAKELICNTLEHRLSIDKLIKETAENWKLERIDMVDRNILRIAIYELIFYGKTPPIVVINEAIDIAKKYGTANSGAFVNGILDKIRLKKEKHKIDST